MYNFWLTVYLNLTRLEKKDKQLCYRRRDVSQNLANCCITVSELGLIAQRTNRSNGVRGLQSTNVGL